MDALDEERRARRVLRDSLLAAQAAPSVTDILRAALRGVRAGLGWPLGHAYVLANDGTGALVSARVWCSDDLERFRRFRDATEATRLQAGRGLPGRVLSTGRSVFMDNLGIHPDFPRAALDPGIEVNVGVAFPVTAGERVVAVLEFFTVSEEPVSIDAPMRDAMEIVGRELGHAIERHWTIKALSESESRFQAVARSASDAIISADLDGRITFWNRAAEGLFGYAEAEIIGQHLNRIVPPAYSEAHERGIARQREGAPPRVLGRTVVLEGLRRDGTLFPVELSLARWSVGEASFYSGIIRDISERRAAERKLLDALHKLEVSEQRARDVSLELQRKNEELEARRQVLDADLREASAFQRAMLPSLAELRALPPAVTAHACYEPAEVVGGDLYDVAPRPGGGLRVFIADTVGHGVQASLRTMVVKTLYERHKSVATTPAALLARVNADAVAMHPERQLRFSACCFDLHVDASGARLRYANAGQLPLVVMRGAEATEIYEPGSFVGMTAATDYVDREAALLPGDRLYAYTDGLVEQWSPAGERLQESRVLTALGAPGELTDVMRAAVADLARFRGDNPLPDDLTLLGFEVRG